MRLALAANVRPLRRVGIGRDNWLHLDSDQAGVTAAGLYSITATCQQLGVEPFAYLRNTLAQLPNHPADRSIELLPANWAKSQREQKNLA